MLDKFPTRKCFLNFEWRSKISGRAPNLTPLQSITRYCQRGASFLRGLYTRCKHGTLTAKKDKQSFVEAEWLMRCAKGVQDRGEANEHEDANMRVGRGQGAGDSRLL